VRSVYEQCCGLMKLDCNAQSILPSLEAVCRKTLQDINRDSEA
jgi:hypothetical protein